MQEELDEEYLGLSTAGQMMNDPLYGEISNNRSYSNAFELRLGHNVKQFLVQMKAATGKDIAEQVMRPVKVIPLVWLWRVKPHCCSVFIDFGGIR